VKSKLQEKNKQTKKKQQGQPPRRGGVSTGFFPARVAGAQLGDAFLVGHGIGIVRWGSTVLSMELSVSLTVNFFAAPSDLLFFFNRGAFLVKSCDRKVGVNAMGLSNGCINGRTNHGRS
jgi:hypothetical protein